MRVKRLRRGVLAFGAAAMLGVSVLLAGCGGVDPTEAITEDIEAGLSIIEDTDSDEYQELVDMMDASAKGAGIDEYGITGEEIVDSLFDGYEYEIAEIEVDKEAGEATATVEVTCKSLSDIEDKMYELMYDALENPDLYSMTEEELNAEIGRIVQGAFDEVEPRTTDLELTYSEDDGEWTADADPFNELADCFM